MRPILHFFLIGALLFAAKRQLTSDAVKELTVSVPQTATAGEIQRAIDEAILLEQAIARGALLSDPVIREQLRATMRLEPAAREKGEQSIERAIALGVHRGDPVVRARLALQAEQLVVAAAPPDAPSDATLGAYIDAHAARYGSPATLSLEQVYVRPERHGLMLARDLDVLARALADGIVPPERLGDPTSLPRAVHGARDDLLNGRFGPGFAAAVADAPAGRWTGPIPSSYGVHFVRVIARTSARVPPLAEIRQRVLADYRHDRRAAILRDGLRALRAQYRIRVARGPA